MTKLQGPPLLIMGRMAQVERKAAADRLLKEQWQQRSHDLCRMLRGLGWLDGSVRFEVGEQTAVDIDSFTFTVDLDGSITIDNMTCPDCEERVACGYSKFYVNSETTLDDLANYFDDVVVNLHINNGLCKGKEETG